jgi:hypothetical protein
VNAFIWLVVCASAMWVYYDATRHKIGKIPNKSGMTNMSAGAWAVVTFFMWIVGLPVYLINRQRLIQEASTSPVEPSGRALKLVAMGLLTLLWVAVGAAMDQQADRLATASAADVELARAMENIQGLDEELAAMDEEDRAPPPPPSNEPLPVVSIRELWSAYENNEMRADAAFKGKRFIVEGKVDQVSKDVFGNVVVHLRGPNQFIPVYARLADERLAMELDKGMPVRWACTGGGKVVMSPQLDRCVPK